MLSEAINVTREHLSRVFNRHLPLSESMGKRIAASLGVSWDVVKQPESRYMIDLINLALVDFLHKPDALDWKSSVRLADKMGILSRSSVDSGEATAAQLEDEELLGVGDEPDVDWEAWTDE